MHGDALHQPGAGSALRACLVTILVIVSLPARARGQAQTDTTREIPVHPRVTTILQLPDDVELARFTAEATGMMRVTKLRELLYIRPRAGLPAGTEVVLWVKTATVRQRFLLRVVRHARDALPAAIVLGPETEPAPAPPTEPGEPVPDEKPAETPVIRSPRTEISVHFVSSLGFTGLDVPGHEPFIARQPHAGLGARLAVTRTDAWWALEASITGEWPGGSMSFADGQPQDAAVAVDGPWLRTELGMRGLLGGTKWNPSLYVGLGVQAHLRRTEDSRPLRSFSETMPRGAVLVLGIGLQRRARKLLLGLDFQVREGGPDGYHSAAVLWTAGVHLDPD